MQPNRNLLCAALGALALIAFAGTWTQNVAYFHSEDGLVRGFALATARFWPATLATPASTSITVDICLFTLAASMLMIAEARRLGIRFVWVYIVLGILVAISVTFPLFLIARERAIARNNATSPSATFRAADIAGLVVLAAGVITFSIWTMFK